MIARSLLKAALPVPVVERVRGNSAYLWTMRQKESIRAYGTRNFIRYSLNAPLTRRRFARLNDRLPTSRIALAKTVEFNTCAEAREGHEWFAYRDPESVEEIQSFIHHSRDRTCLLDVGALFGTFSLTFAAMGGRAIAIEPSPEPLGALNANIALNPSLNVRSLQLALSDHNGSLTMQTEWKHYIASESGVLVRCATLDDFVNELGAQPDAIKIDVEGHELAVLKGGFNYIKERKPIIFLEIDNWHAPDTTGAILELLMECGYRIHSTSRAHIRPPFTSLRAGIRRVVCLPN